MTRKVMFLLGVFLLTSAQMLFAQEKTITGTVTDEAGSPMPGVSILIKGTSKGVATDFDGNYSIEAKKGDVLVFSYIGFSSQDVTVGSSSRINVKLKESAQQLDDVVVVGYGTQKKVNMTGSVNTVKADDIKGKATTSLATALQGVSPGVTVISRPGNVGDDMGSINVRGRGNLGTSEPLYIVDGVPVSSGDFQRIPPGDVESISVLKDAAATAIYGARAAYGVFLVTTKKGKEGKSSVNYNAYYGFQSPTILPKRLGSEGYATLLNEAYANAGKTKPAFTDEEMQKIKSHSDPLYPDNDWASLFYKDQAAIQEHNISLSGGGKTRYFVSGTFLDQESLVPGTKLNRYSIRANTERQFTDRFKLGTNISYVQDNYKEGGAYSASQHVDRISPLTVNKNPDGTWGTVTAGKLDENYANMNPLRRIEEGGWGKYESNRFIGTLNAEYKVINNLTLTGMVSYRTFDKRKSDYVAKYKPFINWFTKKPIPIANLGNGLTNTWYHTRNYMGQLYATYSKEIGKNDLSLMLGAQYEGYYYEWLKAGRKDYPTNSLETIGAGSNSAENLSNDGDIQERKFFSQFGRLTYAYDNRYLFEANVRVDQSSQFNKDNRVGVFPSFSAGWRISQEDFMKGVDWLTNAKLRLSWGQSGYVNNVGYYDYYDVLGLGSAYVTGGVLADGAWPSLQVNKDFTWETVTTENIGFDATLFRRLSFQIDLFNKVSRDILLKMPQPYELGLIESRYASRDERAATNAGVVSNKGLEISLTYRQTIKDWKYSISANMSKIWNKIEDMNGLDDQVEGRFIKKVGGSIGDFYGYKALGLFIDDAEVASHAKQSGSTRGGDIKYADIKPDGVINSEDRTVIGNDVPYFTYGLSASVNYKGFDLSIQGQGVRDVDVYFSEEASYAFFNAAGVKEYHLGRWTKQNPDPNAIYPRILESSVNNHNLKTSSFWLFDADYFRIKSIILGYTFDSDVSKLIGCENIRFYVSGTNLFTIRADQRLKDFDPEMPTGRASYPNLKTVSFGANISF